MELSKRLQAVADLVTAGYRVADIGTDHAYIPIFLLASGKIPGAAAMDVNEGPLERARCHIEENGLTEKISLRLSDGLAGLRPGEAESVVIAGMGGGLIIRILTEGIAHAAVTTRKTDSCTHRFCNILGVGAVNGAHGPACHNQIQTHQVVEIAQRLLGVGDVYLIAVFLHQGAEALAGQFGFVAVPAALENQYLLF